MAKYIGGYTETECRIATSLYRELRDREHRVRFGSVKTMRNTSRVVQEIRVASV